jgi:type IV secretion system protein VirD4
MSPRQRPLSLSERSRLDPFVVATGDASPRDQRDLMERPFFSLAKAKRTSPIHYEAGDVRVEVFAVPEHGMATIWDADILIWAASQIVEAANLGFQTSRFLRFTPYQLLTAIGRQTGSRDYRLLKGALARLQSTVKGVGLVVPTLLTWPGSAIVHDIKGENWQLTAGFRARHGRVLLFDPTNAKSAAYNPLLEVRRGEWEVRDVQNVADVLVDPEGSLDKRNHWEKTSHSLLVGAILHVLYAEEDKTLAGVAAFLSDPRRPIEATLKAMMTTTHLGPGGPHPVVASTARELLNKSDNERSGVLSTAMSFLGLYRDPVVAEVTRRCDWRIADLIADDKPATLYLVVPPSDISRTKPLIRLVLNQIGRRLTEDLHARDRRHRVLMMLDEFPALGRLDFFESALAFMAGYGLKSFLIAQSLNQIEKAYGPNNAILDNCHVRVSFATNDERTAKRVSDALGTATEMKAMRNYAGHRLSPWLGHLMVSRSETARPLLTPGEVMQLPATDEIVMAAGVHPIRAKKARYFEDRRFKERILPSPDPAKCGRSARKDAWSELQPQRPAAVLAAELDKAEDAANGGLRREPELPDHVAIAKETTGPAAADEFSIMLDDEPEDAARQRQALRQQMRGVARQVALDPNDGIDL